MMTTLNLYWLSPGSVPFAYAGTDDAWVLETQSEGERILNHVLRHNFDWPGLDREVIYDSSQDSPPLPPPTKLSPAPIELEF